MRERNQSRLVPAFIRDLAGDFLPKALPAPPEGSCGPLKWRNAEVKLVPGRVPLLWKPWGRGMAEVPGWTGLRDGRPSTTPWQLHTDRRGPTPAGQDGDVLEGPRALLVWHRRQSKVGEKRLGEQGVPGPAALQPHGAWKQKPFSQPGAPGALSLLPAKPEGEGPTSQRQLVGLPVSLSSPRPPANPEINQKIKSVTLVFCIRAPHRAIH